MFKVRNHGQRRGRPLTAAAAGMLDDPILEAAGLVCSSRSFDTMIVA